MKNWTMYKKLLFMMFTISTFVYFLIILSHQQAYAKTNERSSIVKIYTVSAEPYYAEPWSMNVIESSSGSGCVIEGNRILTNAHVVSDQTFLQVRLNGKPEKYPAKVLAVSHESDLAILTVENLSFFKGVKPLKIGKLPEIQQDVVVYGFPKGGDTLSVTKGVVSRVEHSDYAHSQLTLLAVQIDAPINSGNSGGPVIVNNRISGIVMQAIEDSQSIGYMVPAPIINHFLNDISDDNYDGFPTLGIAHQKIENEALKKKYNLSNKQSGVLITFISPGSSADGKLQVEDVILSVENNDISGDGTIEFRQNERTSFNYFVQEKQIGDNLKLNILRNGSVKSIQLLLKSSLGDLSLVPRQHFDIKPSYFIYGGLILRPLTKNYLLSWGDDWDEDAPSKLVALYKNGRKQSINNEIVILSKVLPAKINKGYHNYSDLIITHVNRCKINNLKHLIKIVKADNKNKFVEFKTKEDKQIVIDRQQAQTYLSNILQTYNVPYDRSENFRKI